ncbi:MAG TPA: cupin domain-containing protein [Candidatus Competibacteraceae bacterium]|nr:MAG: cupin domain-containing protein [Candidatus Competibacteraceae bacterium]HOB60822.1 cupin domain-containing protein [Candidatus Competibacteraceae bacterium]HQA27343.1 cupin domain-containing protein [Candidatus Competibacteraceae bacterium]HQD55164.1 cupin domain-containing protein [Candidatus Competibacteraceae bacterium]
MSDWSAEDWIAYLQLEPHPEGGYFRRAYAAQLQLPAGALPDHGAERAVATAIYYLLPAGQRSRLHRLKSDELWHFYTGSPLTVQVLGASGECATWRLGPDPRVGQHFLLPIRAGCWFGATVDEPSGFSLIGCTVAPGFDFADFELADRDALLRQYPHYAKFIERLT